MATKDLTRRAAEFAVLLASPVAVYLAMSFILDRVSGLPASRKASETAKILEKLGKPDLELTEHEASIAARVIHPDSIHTNFSDIGGLESIISDLRESTIFPLCYPELFQRNAELMSAPKGVLLYGPPGCGKTMLAKAVAKESGATFINITPSVIQDKWFGESNKLVSALFSLARKLEPCIIFIDEIDSFLRERTSGDHEASATIKAEFMTLWDGLASGKGNRILVLGATNRPSDIDAAILRRMPKRFAVKLPNEKQRAQILRLMLSNTDLSPSLSIETLARESEGLSGSDLKELCRNAAMVPVREYIRLHGGDPAEMMKAQQEGFKMRSLTLGDFVSNLSPPQSPTIPLQLPID